MQARYQTALECFERFLLFKRSLGLKEKTIESYAAHFHAVSKYVDMGVDIRSLDKHFMEAAIKLATICFVSSHCQ